jgi:hypothetical protein
MYRQLTGSSIFIRKKVLVTDDKTFGAVQLKAKRVQSRGSASPCGIFREWRVRRSAFLQTCLFRN